METTYVTNNRKLSVTPRDVKVFTFIEAYIRIHGFAPLLTEIAKEIGATKQSIHFTISRLEMMGCISRNPHTVRGIIPLKSPIL